MMREKFKESSDLKSARDVKSMQPPAPGPVHELGVTRLFGIGDISNEGLTKGWAIPEDAHTWNDGLESIMELWMPVSSNGYQIEFEGEPFINTAVQRQDVSFYVNGFRTGFWRMTESKPYLLSATVEREQVFSRGDLAFARLVWFLPDSVRPSDLKLNSDGRQLGFCFRSITVRPITVS